MIEKRTPNPLTGWIAALLPLLVVYALTMQTIPNGSSHYFMIDVGETQIVLNVWGTLHATGYPLYVMTGAALTDVLTALGVAAVLAPALVSLLWGVLALTVLYALVLHLTGRVLLAAVVTLLFGLMRTVWIHHVIAEIYTFGLLILLGLLALALWRDSIPHLTTYPARIYWLALLGGIGVAHHRAIAMAIPALLIAVWPLFVAHRRTLPRVLAVSLALGTLGFAQYLYMPLRAQAGAGWVYGDPSTWEGFWHEFMGREASRFIGSPETLAGIIDNAQMVTEVLLRDLTAPGLVAGVLGLLLALRADRLRRAAVVLLLNGLAAYAFHVFFYTDILSALILPVLVSVAVGWAFLAEMVVFRGAALRARRTRRSASLHTDARSAETSGMASVNAAAPGRVKRHYGEGFVVVVAALALAAILVTRNADFITGVTTDPTGQETITTAQGVPDGAALLIAWGPRHFAAGFARDVQGRLPQVGALLDHNADVGALLAEGRRIVSPPYTFLPQHQPPPWWEARTGGPVYLYTAAPGLIEVTTAPRFVPERDRPDGDDPQAVAETLTCTDDGITLDVTWTARVTPEADVGGVFVHLLDATGQIIAQDDRRAPVYNQRPLTSWLPGEAIREIYTLPRLPDAAAVRYGFWTQNARGEFINAPEITREVCDG